MTKFLSLMLSTTPFVNTFDLLFTSNVLTSVVGDQFGKIIERPGRLWLSVMTTILIGSPEEWRRRERMKSSTCSWWVTLRWNLSSAPGITLRYFCPVWCWAASAQEWSQSWWTSLGQVAWTPAGNLSEAAGSRLSPTREKISSLIMTVSFLPMNSLQWLVSLHEANSQISGHHSSHELERNKICKWSQPRVSWRECGFTVTRSCSYVNRSQDRPGRLTHNTWVTHQAQL